MAALLGGEVKLTSQVPSVSAPHIASARVRAVGQTGAKRLAAIPDIPTLKEQGADVEFYLWAGMVAPAGTPKSIIDTLDGAVTKAMNDPEFMGMMQKAKIVTAHMGSTEFNRWWADDARKLAELVKKLGPIK
jgi:tripartite-type tricarboxylate transporter receptor subunit TctC